MNAIPDDTRLLERPDARRIVRLDVGTQALPQLAGGVERAAALPGVATDGRSLRGASGLVLTRTADPDTTAARWSAAQDGGRPGASVSLRLTPRGSGVRAEIKAGPWEGVFDRGLAEASLSLIEQLLLNLEAEVVAAPVGEASVPSLPEPDPPPPTTRGRDRRLLVAGIAAALLAVAGLLWARSSQDRSSGDA